MKTHTTLMKRALFVAAALALCPATHAADTVKVFVLAGQSNMEGKAKNELLDHQATDPKTAEFYKPYRKGNEWVVRDDVFIKAPNMPFVIGALGQNGSKPAEGTTLVVRDAQLAMNDVPAFKGNVKAIRTDVLVDKNAEKMIVGWKDHVEEWKKVGSDRGYHYYGSGIWFTRIGNAFGESMLELMKYGR